MVVSIDFTGRQRALTQERGIDMLIDDTTRVADALAYVRSRYPALALREGSVLATVNHRMAPLDRLLQADDNVAFLPPIAGG